MLSWPHHFGNQETNAMGTYRHTYYDKIHGLPLIELHVIVE